MPFDVYTIVKTYKAYDGTNFRGKFDNTMFRGVAGASIVAGGSYFLFMPGGLLQSKTWDESLISWGVEIIGFTGGFMSVVAFRYFQNRRDVDYSIAKNTNVETLPESCALWTQKPPGPQ